MKGKSVLLVDDEKKVLFLLSDALEEHGFIVKSTTLPSEALTVFEMEAIDVVLLDLVMPQCDGIEVLKVMKRIKPNIPVIMLSGHGTITRAVEAVKLGAHDFLEKPVSSEKIALAIKNAVTQSLLVKDKLNLIETVKKEYAMIGVSGAMKELENLIDKMAPTDLPVLICGESGTGKELVARSLHLKSNRAARPFVPLNCAAIPDNLLESELFGYRKGAFTGACEDKPGLFELANWGTLFLDEISEMSIRLQPKLLRVLEGMELRRLGDTQNKKLNFRLVCASNVNLKEAIENKSFREDLFYRLTVLMIHVPPLRQRKEDIPVLAKHFAMGFCRERKRESICFHPHALEILMNHPWPGNVRQLKNMVEKIVVLSEDREISSSQLVKYLEENHNGRDVQKATTGETLNQVRKRAEKEGLLIKLASLDWDYNKVAKELKISRATLFNKLKEFDIGKKKNRDPGRQG